MDLENKIGFLTKLRKDIKRSLTTRIIALSLFGGIGLGYINCGSEEEIKKECTGDSDCSSGYFCYEGYCVEEELKNNEEICDGKDNDFDGYIDKSRFCYGQDCISGYPLKRCCNSNIIITPRTQGFCSIQECINGRWGSCTEDSVRI